MASVLAHSQSIESKHEKADIVVSSQEIGLEEEKTAPNVVAKSPKSFLDEMAVFIEVHKKHMIEYEKLLADLKVTEDELHRLQHELYQTKQRADKTADHLHHTRAELHETKDQLHKTADHLHHARAELRHMKDQGQKHCTRVTFNEHVVTSWGENVFVTGNLPQLGSWDLDKAVALNPSQYSSANPLWSVSIDLPVDVIVEYKYIKKETDGNVVWEGNLNRSHAIPDTPSHTITEDDSWR